MDHLDLPYDEDSAAIAAADPNQSQASSKRTVQAKSGTDVGLEGGKLTEVVDASYMNAKAKSAPLQEPSTAEVALSLNAGDKVRPDSILDKHIAKAQFFVVSFRVHNTSSS
jgi:hypothetical protein